MAELHASQVVWIETKIVIKDDDDNVELPSNFTKRGMYERWCLDRGWVAKARVGNGSYGRIAKYETRKTQEGTDWPLDSVSLLVCCFNTFISYWKKNFPSIKIKNSSHDTCGTCYLFERQLNGLRRREHQTSIRILREERLSAGVPEAHVDG